MKKRPFSGKPVHSADTARAVRPHAVTRRTCTPHAPHATSTAYTTPAAAAATGS